MKISDSKEARAFGDLSKAFVADFKDYVANLAKFRHIRYHCLEVSKSDSRTLEIFNLENTFHQNYKRISFAIFSIIFLVRNQYFFEENINL